MNASLEKAEGLVEKGGDWDRKNRYKDYKALQVRVLEKKKNRIKI